MSLNLFFKQLLQISKYAGLRHDLVQAGGGNSSIKIADNQMFIKASGVSLSDVSESSGFSVVNYKVLLDALEKDDTQESICLNSSLVSGNRPSIESFLHALTKRVTLHTHPTLVNVLSVRKGGFDELKTLFPEAIFVDYETPGIRLAKLLKRELNNSDSQAIQVIFMKNHGLVVAAEKATDVISMTESVIDRIADYLGVNNSPYKNITILYDKLQSHGLMKTDEVVYLSTDVQICEYLRDHDNDFLYAFCPDCLVYCHRRAMRLPKTVTQSFVDDFLMRWGKPNIFIYEGNLYIVAPSLKKAREIESVLRMSLQILVLNQGKEMDYLSDKEQNFLLNWESEKYRQQQS